MKAKDIKTHAQLIEFVKAEKHKGRDGVPSCSALEYYRECPARLMTCGQFYDTEQSGEMAVQGNCGHWYVYQSLQLTHEAPYLKDEGWVLEGCPEDLAFEVQWVISQIKAYILEGWKITGAEQYADKPYLTGTYDLKLERAKEKTINEVDIIFIDYKFGRIEVPQNTYQLAGYFHINDIAEGQGLVLQPKVRSQELFYFKPEMVANAEIIAKNAMNPDAPQMSNEACKFCIACGTEDCKVSTKCLSDLVDASENKKFKEPPLERHVIMAYKAKKIAQKVLDDAKLCLQTGEVSYDSFTLKKGRQQRYITDTVKAIAVLKDVLGKELYNALSITLGKAEDTYAINNDLSKAKSKVAITEALGD